MSCSAAFTKAPQFSRAHLPNAGGEHRPPHELAPFPTACLLLGVCWDSFPQSCSETLIFIKAIILVTSVTDLLPFLGVCVRASCYLGAIPRHYLTQIGNLGIGGARVEPLLCKLTQLPWLVVTACSKRD